jgi:hypothetical protein
MEILVRIAVQKYYKTKTTNTMFEAVKLLFEKNVLPFINKFDQSDVPYILKFDSHDWRVKRLWNE